MIKKLASLAFFSAIYLNLPAQTKYDSLLTISSTKYPQEKIYLHLDKSYYNSGETVWFKAYITASNNPTQISKTMYAELVNSNGVILQRKIMPILQGGAASFFDLNDSAYTAKLMIRAYTSWMLNFDQSLIYLKPLTVIIPKQIEKPQAVKDIYTLNLFPEGGDIIENISCRVAFKTNNQDGIPFPVSGIVADDKGNKICNLTSLHDGMGYFEFSAKAGEKYRAIWKDKTGQQHETALPDAKKQGLGLRLDNSTGKLTYFLTRPDSVDESLKSFIVVAQMNQQMVYSARINMHRKTLISAPIFTDSLPDGVIQITVFTETGLPIAERIAFVNNNTYYFETDLHAVEKNITRHGKSVLQVDVGGNLLANLSISVTDAGLDSAGNNRENIFSSMLLSSDCKGYIYNPAYYFSSDEDSVKQQLDLVMMTSGWRRFRWNDLLANHWPKIDHTPDNYISLKGKVYGLSRGQLTNRQLTGILKTSAKNGNSFFSIPMDVTGNFNANGLYFFDTVKLYYQLNNDKDRILTTTASFSFENGFEKAPAFSPGLFSSVLFNPRPDSSIIQKNSKISALFRSQEEMIRTKTLKTVVVTTRQKTLKEKLDEEYSTGMFKGGESRIFTTEDDPFAQSALTVLDYLRGKVAGLTITTGGQPSITRRGSNTDVFLDEMTTDLNMLQSIPMTDVAMVKVFDPPFFGAMGGGAGGAVAVYTKKGGTNEAAKGLNSVLLYGYSALRQFYMPNYEKSDDASAADYRTTLYWNPYLLMDTKIRRISIPVFNSDNCKKIRVVIEGINEAGQLTREEKIFE